MAIKKTLLIPSKGSSFQVPEAYISVSHVRVEPMVSDEGVKSWELSANVNIHVDRQAKRDGLQPIDRADLIENFPADQEVNPLTWVYERLKSDERFIGAVDVIE